MILRILGSNSKGNCYILEAEHTTESLLIECGVRWDKMKQGLNFKLNRVAGCLLTHEHGDHAKSYDDLLKAGIKVVSSYGTHKALGGVSHHRACVITHGQTIYIGGFTVKAFNVKHDCAQPFGYLIHHEECGSVLFITDSYYVPYTFPNINNIIVEANYSKEIIDRKRSSGYLPQFLNDRIIASHMSLETCKDLLRANDLSQVNNIVLIHLSDGTSDALNFKNQITALTGKNVHVADAGDVLYSFNKTPF